MIGTSDGRTYNSDFDLHAQPFLSTANLEQEDNSEDQSSMQRRDLRDQRRGMPIDQTHHVPLVASAIMGNDGSMIGMAVDHRLKMSDDDKELLALHEGTELPYMNDLVKNGMSPPEAYAEAHKWATARETAASIAKWGPEGHETYKDRMRENASIASQPSDQDRHPQAHTTVYGLDEHEGVYSVAQQFTPLSDEEKKALMDTTGIPKNSEILQEGTGVIRDMMNQSQEELDKLYDDAVKSWEGEHGSIKGHVLGPPLPAGRLRVRKDNPVVQEYIKHLPKDELIHDMGDGTIIIRKAPYDDATPVSSLNGKKYAMNMKPPYDPMNDNVQTDAPTPEMAAHDRAFHSAEESLPFVMTRSLTGKTVINPAANQNDPEYRARILENFNKLRDRLLPKETKTIPPDVVEASKQLGHLGFDRPGQAINALREDIKAGKTDEQMKATKGGWDIRTEEEHEAFDHLLDYIKNPPLTEEEWKKINPDLFKYAVEKNAQQRRSQFKTIPGYKDRKSTTDQLREWLNETKE